MPRPAFDSRVLSLLAAPDSIVRSLNEAVNYQFGFDITSSWGYQLLVRSFAWLLAFGALVLVGLNMIVVVEPHQQAVKLSGGAIVGGVHGSGIMWKAPWPFATAAVYDIDRIRSVHLTARRVEDPDVQAWSKGHQDRHEAGPVHRGRRTGGARCRHRCESPVPPGSRPRPSCSRSWTPRSASTTGSGPTACWTTCSSPRRGAGAPAAQHAGERPQGAGAPRRDPAPVGLALGEVIAEGRGALAGTGAAPADPGRPGTT